MFDEERPSKEEIDAARKRLSSCWIDPNITDDDIVNILLVDGWKPKERNGVYEKGN